MFLLYATVALAIITLSIFIYWIIDTKVAGALSYVDDFDWIFVVYAVNVGDHKYDYSIKFYIRNLT